MNRQVNCQFFKDHLNAYLDSELNQETRGGMIRHADQCPDCGERLETMTRLLTMCAELDEGLAVPLDVQAAWRRAVREEAAKGKRRRPKRSGLARALGTVAAAFVLLVGGTFAYRIVGLREAEPAGSRTYPPAVTRTDAGYPVAYKQAPAQAPGERDVLKGIDGAAEDAVFDGGAGEAGAEDQSKVVIRNAQRAFESPAFDQALQSIAGLVNDFNGYFEQQSVNSQPDRTLGRTASLTARVPEADLDDFLAALDAVGSLTLTYKGETEEDISGNYFDVESRLEFYRTQLNRYNEMAATAEGLEDMLLLSEKANEVQLQIDELGSQIRSWDNYVNKATVYIELAEVDARENGQADQTLEERVSAAFNDSKDWLGVFLQDAAIVLAMAAPALVIVIPLIIVLCVIVSAVKRRRRRKGR